MVVRREFHCSSVRGNGFVILSFDVSLVTSGFFQVRFFLKFEILSLFVKKEIHDGFQVHLSFQEQHFL